MQKRLFLAFSILAIFTISPASIRAWEPVGIEIQPVRMPASSQRLVSLEQTDFDGDGMAESMEIVDGRVRILSGDTIRWQSPSEWNVRQVGLSDLNRDGAVEAVLLVWRPFQSWPVDRWLPNGGRIDEFMNAQGESCHIILIGWHREKFTERWAGSALAQPIKTFRLVDTNRDGFDELITLESTYETPAYFPANALKVWEWNGFGFSLVSKLEGAFNDLLIVQAPNQRLIFLTP